MLIFGYGLQLQQCIEAGCPWQYARRCFLGLRLLLGYCNYYAIHTSPYMSTHVLIENTLVQHRMAKACTWHCVAKMARTWRCVARI